MDKLIRRDRERLEEIIMDGLIIMEIVIEDLSIFRRKVFFRMVFFLRKVFRRKYRDKDAWRAVRSMFSKSMLCTKKFDLESVFSAEPLVSEVVAAMKRPTVGELIRVLSTDDHATFRRLAIERGAQTSRKHPLDGMKSSVKRYFEDYLGELRRLSHDDRVPTMPDPWRDFLMRDSPIEELADRKTAIWLAKSAWLAELASMAEAEVWDKALPPPAPAAPSTRGRL